MVSANSAVDPSCLAKLQLSWMEMWQTWKKYYFHRWCQTTAFRATGTDFIPWEKNPNLHVHSTITDYINCVGEYYFAFIGEGYFIFVAFCFLLFCLFVCSLVFYFQKIRFPGFLKQCSFWYKYQTNTKTVQHISCYFSDEEYQSIT